MSDAPTDEDDATADSESVDRRTTTADSESTDRRTTTADSESVDRRTTTADSESTDRRTTTAPATDDRFAVPLRGVDVDPKTRCAHWDDPVDVVALRFGCCEAYYPCDACHDAAADHESEPWPRARFDEPAVLCGSCGATLTATAYLDGVGETCPECHAAFNPGCRAHRDRYFEV